MNDVDFLADRFEAHRARLKSVAYRMLGSLTEADDAVQEAWLRLSRSDADEVENLGGWLTTVVGRVCLDMLRSRVARREDPLDVHMPDPIISWEEGIDPEQEAVVADSVGLALLVVLQTLAPAERLAFVLHDMFALPYDDIASVVGRSPAAARQLASRARRRVQGTAPEPDADLATQRHVVDAFIAAARGGDLESLVALLDPEVVLRADTGAMRVIRGRKAVAGQALSFSRFASTYAAHPALVNGSAGVVSTDDGVPQSVLCFTIADGKIAAIDILADPDRLSRLDVAFLDH
ncbi:RNA polymerase sigma factor SigJ [Actinomadura barringtoniae]|uniref:RNA polymerase sigma factor SigJ n=1 Tax=Actinomadura barringtoniae TaxID=1427535 RepID=A0A939T686_9ACTN|nr:RNA polymerase sigma factor SigJ [Actinomadura barringtoniae]MBO2454641.1 RNA polymerase sigma factor SigJ [Actinomadura barringtoniae]